MGNNLKKKKKNQVFFSIIPRGPSLGSNDQVTIESGNDRVTTDSGNRVPEEIAIFLNEYKEIVAEDIPDGLPLVRSISHYMDLIFGASLPNKAPYRLTPTKNEELNRQVHEI